MRLKTTVAAIAIAASLALGGCTASPPTSTVGPPRSPDHMAQLHHVAWRNVGVPGSVCEQTHTIKLSAGHAVVGAPPGLGVGASELSVSLAAVDYGELGSGDQPVAALDIWCTTSAGTADGQLKNSWVIFDLDADHLRVIGELVPQQHPGSSPSHMPYFDSTAGGIRIERSGIVVRELWYGPDDPTCCPTIRATTTWTFAAGRFVRASTATAATT